MNSTLFQLISNMLTLITAMKQFDKYGIVFTGHQQGRFQLYQLIWLSSWCGTGGYAYRDCLVAWHSPGPVRARSLISGTCPPKGFCNTILMTRPTRAEAVEPREARLLMARKRRRCDCERWTDWEDVSSGSHAGLATSTGNSMNGARAAPSKTPAGRESRDERALVLP